MPQSIYFRNNGVEVKVISGDNPLTVSEIAARAGVRNVIASSVWKDSPMKKLLKLHLITLSLAGSLQPKKTRVGSGT
jgi:cation-transporting ATPase E